MQYFLQTQLKEEEERKKCEKITQIKYKKIKLIINYLLIRKILLSLKLYVKEREKWRNHQ